MSIVNECMVVNLRINMWTGHRLDREASKSVTEKAGADEDAARVNKHLIPKEILQPISSAAGALRNHFYDNTLPWKDNGDRLLTRKAFQRFIEEHEKLAKDFNDEVRKFIEVNYYAARQKAEFRMGAMFKPSDYPAADELRGKFSASLDIDAVTTANDFRVQMSAPMQDKIREDIEEKMKERLGKAMQSVWVRLSQTLEHFANSMATDKKLYESTITNLEEIVEILPELNVLNDSNLDRIRDEIKATIVGYDVKDLRKNPEVRNIAASEAKRIMDDMKGFMTAFGA